MNQMFEHLKIRNDWDQRQLKYSNNWLIKMSPRSLVTWAEMKIDLEGKEKANIRWDLIVCCLWIRYTDSLCGILFTISDNDWRDWGSNSLQIWHLLHDLGNFPSLIHFMELLWKYMHPKHLGGRVWKIYEYASIQIKCWGRLNILSR